MATPAQPSLIPPLARETAAQKVRKAEDGWNSRDPEKVSLVDTVDSRWRNRAEFITGRRQIVKFLTRKWNRELDYRLIKEPRCVSVRFGLGMARRCRKLVPVLRQ
jgi:nuclear transport factor 2 (NTF2) superfamily protein